MRYIYLLTSASSGSYAQSRSHFWVNSFCTCIIDLFAPAGVIRPTEIKDISRIAPANGRRLMDICRNRSNARKRDFGIFVCGKNRYIQGWRGSGKRALNFSQGRTEQWIYSLLEYTSFIAVLMLEENSAGFPHSSIEDFYVC